MPIVQVNQISSQTGSVLTIGQSGDTVTLAAGATATGFGRTGAVNWDTTPKTTTVTAVSGVGYFVDTTSGAITVNLPATPSAGSIVGVMDYAGTAATNNITIARNGSNIEGQALNAGIATNRDSITLLYVDATQGWLPIADNTTSSLLPAYVAATGGTITTCGNYKIHTFTSPGSFIVSNAGNSVGSNTVEYLTVAGGGGSGGSGPSTLSIANYSSGGGGAGGYRTNFPSPVTTGLPVAVTTYPITIGGGGTGGPTSSPYLGTSGSDSIFSTITSAGGGAGGPGGTPGTAGSTGGSGGGGGGGNPPNSYVLGGTGNTPPVSPPQGNPGGTGSSGGPTGGGGGGGASSLGLNGPTPVSIPSPAPSGTGGAGGNGTANLISGPSVTYAGGGGGAGGYFTTTGTGGAGGPGGGGTGGGSSGPGPAQGVAGTANTGGGAGGTQNFPSTARTGNAGGSGIVVIRYKYQ